MLRNFIGGSWEEGRGAQLTDENPARLGEVIDTFRSADFDQVERAVEAAAAAFPRWRRTPAAARAAILETACQLLRDRAERYGTELAREEGKTLAEGIGEVNRAAEVLRYHAGEAHQEIGSVYPSAREGERIWTIEVPVGPTAVITPWNFPLFIPAFKLGPALVHGNTVVWKPSELVPGLSIRLTEVFEEAGLPPGVLNLVLGTGAEARHLIAQAPIRACTFTGSTPVGRSVIAACASRGIRSQAEMGGKNTAIVFDDADLDQAADHVVAGAMRSTGQKCTATSRVIVSAGIFDLFMEKLAARASALVVGDPLEAGVDVGPVVSKPQHDKVLAHLATAQSTGAQAICGGGAGPDRGHFVEPTILVGVTPDQPIFTDEVFGPVLVAVPAASDDEAFALANQGEFGLSGAVFTSHLGRVLRATQEFEVGVLHINSETTGADVHVPFGGVKGSGTADREQGKSARTFYTETKTVYAS